MESDRMGYMINTVTQPVLDNEKEVVKNEKRQRVDNQPYGHTNYVIGKAMYPEGHPYSWQIIGSMQDLNESTLDDVKEFYDKYYGPNNATLVLAGDFDKDQVRTLIEKYFGEIPSRPTEQLVMPKTAVLPEATLLYHEDNFCQLPELTLSYPTVSETHPDYYALAFLGPILASGKRAPLFKKLVEEEKLAPRVRAGNRSLELAGKFQVKVRANPGVSLNDVLSAIDEAFNEFERDGIDPRDIDKIKNAQEIEFYQGISSVLNKSFQLAQYNVFRGEPSKLQTEVRALLAVNKEQIFQAYNKYLKDKPCIVTSFVPKGRLDLVVNGSKEASVVEEKLDNAALAQQKLETTENQFEKTPSHFDRSAIPLIGAEVGLVLPKYYEFKLSNGINVLGTEDHRLPVVEFSIILKGGMLFDQPNKIGVANLITDMLMEGTADKTPEQLQDAIHQLGANIQMYTNAEFIEIHGSSLKRNLPQTIDLLEEILTKPRWDAHEFDRVKDKTITDIKQQLAKPTILSGLKFKEQLYGDHILSNFTMGSEGSVSEITLSELQTFYNQYFVPNLAAIHIVGAISEREVHEVFASLADTWQPNNQAAVNADTSYQSLKNHIYFIDIPGAKQSVINAGNMGPRGDDLDLNVLSFVNYRLGGHFNSLLNKQLREERGYTYGVRSRWTRRINHGMFVINTSVHTQATQDSIKIIQDTLSGLPQAFGPDEIDKIRKTMLRSNARAFETLQQKLGVLEKRSTYGLPADYIKQKIESINQMDQSKIFAAIEQYAAPEGMIYVVAGDAENQLANLEKLGLPISMV